MISPIPQWMIPRHRRESDHALLACAILRGCKVRQEIHWKIMGMLLGFQLNHLEDSINGYPKMDENGNPINVKFT